MGIRRGDYPLSSKCAIGEGGLRAVDGTQADTEEEAVFKDNVSNYGELRAAIPNLFMEVGFDNFISRIPSGRTKHLTRQNVVVLISA